MDLQDLLWISVGMLVGMTWEAVRWIRETRRARRIRRVQTALRNGTM